MSPEEKFNDEKRKFEGGETSRTNPIFKIGYLMTQVNNLFDMFSNLSCRKKKNPIEDFNQELDAWGIVNYRRKYLVCLIEVGNKRYPAELDGENANEVYTKLCADIASTCNTTTTNVKSTFTNLVRSVDFNSTLHIEKLKGVNGIDSIQFVKAILEYLYD